MSFFKRLKVTEPYPTMDCPRGTQSETIKNVLLEEVNETINNLSALLGEACSLARVDAYGSGCSCCCPIGSNELRIWWTDNKEAYREAEAEKERLQQEIKEREEYERLKAKFEQGK